MLNTKIIITGLPVAITDVPPSTYEGKTTDPKKVITFLTVNEKGKSETFDVKADISFPIEKNKRVSIDCKLSIFNNNLYLTAISLIKT
jgi:hypothetical protein